MLVALHDPGVKGRETAARISLRCGAGAVFPRRNRCLARAREPEVRWRSGAVFLRSNGCVLRAPLNPKCAAPSGPERLQRMQGQFHVGGIIERSGW